MDQNPSFNNDPLIILRLSPACSIESLNVMLEGLRSMNGVSDVKFDLKYTRLCIRSTIDPFVIVKEIGKVDGRVQLIHYNKEPMANHGDKDPKTAPRNHRQPVTDSPKGYHEQRPNAKEDEYFQDDHPDKDPKNARRNHRHQDMDTPNGYKEQRPNVRRDYEDFDKEKGYRRDYYDPSFREAEEYVCRNYQEYRKAPPKMSYDDGMFSNRQSGAYGDQGMPSRDNFRSQSCHYDERNAHQSRYSTPPESHCPRNSQKNHYGTSHESHYARNSQEGGYSSHSRSYDEHRYSTPLDELPYPSRRPPYDEHHRHRSAF